MVPVPKDHIRGSWHVTMQPDKGQNGSPIYDPRTLNTRVRGREIGKQSNKGRGWINRVNRPAGA